jgi:uncharacterized membrane protein YfcA
MKASLFLTIAGIAAADAVNPAPTVATAYLLSTPRPLKRVLIFLSSAVITRMVVGGVLLFGFGQQITWVIDFLSSDNIRRGLQIALGCVLVAGAIYLWTKPKGSVRKVKERRPSPASAGRALSFGTSLTLLECLVAIPYIGGLGSIERARVPVPAELALLTLFNLIYHLPPIALVVVWRRSGAKSIAAIDQIKAKISRSFADRRWAIPVFVMGIGILAWTIAI